MDTDTADEMLVGPGYIVEVFDGYAQAFPCVEAYNCTVQTIAIEAFQEAMEANLVRRERRRVTAVLYGTAIFVAALLAWAIVRMA